MRRAYRISAGSLKNLVFSEEQLADPGVGEVQIEVKAIGLNFADIYTVWGMYKAAPTENFIPGLEYSGVVSRVGPDAGRWQVGEQVMGITRFGAYVDRLNIDEHYLAPIPKGWSVSEGAAFLVQALTAYYGLIELGRLRKGETVLIHSAAGGVGIQANRIAKQYDSYTIGTIGSPHKTELLKKEGYDGVIVRDHRFAEKLKAALDNRPLNLVMECIGGDILKEGFRALTAEGRMIVYGSASFTTHGSKPDKLKMLWRYLRRPKIDPLVLPGLNKSVMGFNLIWLYHQVEKFQRILDALMDMQLPPPIVGERFEFEKLPDAMRKLQSGQTVGKVVVEV